MAAEQRYFFRKEDKLKSRKAIAELFEKGFKFSQHPFRIYCLPDREAGKLVAGIGVSSRLVKKAVARNKIKRLIREAYRLQKNVLSKHLFQKQMGLSIFILYTGKEVPDYSDVYKLTEKIISRLSRFTDEDFKTLA